jgi:hypothetical protein
MAQVPVIAFTSKHIPADHPTVFDLSSSAKVDGLFDSFLVGEGFIDSLRELGLGLLGILNLFQESD